MAAPNGGRLVYVQNGKPPGQILIFVIKCTTSSWQAHGGRRRLSAPDTSRRVRMNRCVYVCRREVGATRRMRAPRGRRTHESRLWMENK